MVGPTDHTIFKSIYFFDPSGHRLELAANTGTPKMAKMLDEVKWDMLNEWEQTKKAPPTPAGCTTAATPANEPPGVSARGRRPRRPRCGFRRLGASRRLRPFPPMKGRTSCS